MAEQALIQHLKAQFHQWKHQYRNRLDEKILIPFPAHLFKENAEPLAVYFNEIETTLQQLAHLPEHATAEAYFFSEKFIQQCAVLQENLIRWQKNNHPSNYLPEFDLYGDLSSTFDDEEKYESE